MRPDFSSSPSGFLLDQRLFVLSDRQREKDSREREARVDASMMFAERMLRRLGETCSDGGGGVIDECAVCRLQ